jgi:bacterioferritin-associated ferredoxin
MIVCVCNRLNEARIRTAVRSGAGSADEVYARCGVERNCGRCQDEIEQMLDAAQAETPLVRAA